MLGTYALSSGYYDAYYLKALKVRNLIRGDFVRAFERCDCIMMPVAPTTAFKIGEKVDDPLKMYLSDIYTIAVNLAGIPGISVPCGFDDGGPADRPADPDARLQRGQAAADRPDARGPNGLAYEKTRRRGVIKIRISRYVIARSAADEATSILRMVEW